MNLAVYDMSGKQVGSYEIDPAELAPTVNKQLLHDAVVMYQANQRQGTFRTKSRGEVAGSTKKLYRQKGTGNARAGSRRSGTRRGGGRIFAKRPRDFGWRMPKKALRAATRMALAARLADDEVKLVNGLDLAAPKTAAVAKLLKALGIAEKTVLVSPEKHNEMLWKSARNIEGVSVAPVADLNAWTILQPRALLMTTAAIDAFRATVAKVVAAKAAGLSVARGVGRRTAASKSAAARAAARAAAIESKPVVSKPAASKLAVDRKSAKRAKPAAKKEK
ncbi:MAG: 50S ribosomal protein L4 [Planctomycetes bacterium]|nr:50S ribosomal protein L4 [Planctomycetota bacterium]